MKEFLLGLCITILVSAVAFIVAIAGEPSAEIYKAGVNGMELNVGGEKAQAIYDFLNVEEIRSANKLVKSTKSVTCTRIIKSHAFECRVLFNGRGEPCRVAEDESLRVCK